MGELFSYFHKGGLVMYPILLCSIVSVAVFLERWVFYGKRSSGAAFLARLQELARNRDSEGAAALSASAHGDSAELARDFFADGQCDLAALETKVNLLMDAYEEKVFLDIIVTVSPLLGLLGTILGMMSAFKVFDGRGNQPFAITAGIGEALIATAFGLIVAIFALVLKGILRYREDGLEAEIKHCSAILESFKKTVG